MKRVLFVDHVDRILGGAEINVIELLPVARKSYDFEFACACRAESRLDQALQATGVRRFNYGLAKNLNQLRFAGRRFPWLRAWRAANALKEATAALRKIIREFNPAILISCTNKDHFASVKACAGTQARSVWWVNDLITKDFFPWPARVA